MIFKTIRQSLEDVYIAGRKINELNNLRLNATNITAYATALKGLNARQAELVLSTQGLTVAQKQAILSQAELLCSTGKLTTAELETILVTKKRNKDQAEALLINTGLITSETAEATATNVVTAAKLKELVATGKLTKAEANLIAAKAGVTLAYQKGSASLLAGIGANIKGVGTGILTIAQAHPVIAGITAALALCGGAALINKAKQEKAAKAIKEAYEGAKNTIDEINNKYSSNSSQVKEISKEYAELAQGVNLLTNENKNLSIEKYKRFLELSKQLSTLYPSLTKNFDENGVAILDLSGDVDTIVGSLDDLIERQRSLANQEIMKQMPDLFAGYSNNVASLEKQKEGAKKTRDEIQRAYEVLNSWDGSTVWWSNGGQVVKGADNAIRSLSDYTNALDALGIKYKQVAVDLDNDLYHNNDGFSIEADYKQYGSELSDIYVSAFNKASEDIKYAEQQFEAETSSINQYLYTWLQTEFSYNQNEDSGLQTAIQDMLFNFDWNSLPENINKNDWGAVSEYLRRNILFSINHIDDSKVSKALADIYSGSLNSGELLNAIAKVQEYFGSEHLISVNLQVKVDDTQSLINNVKEKLQDDFDDKVEELTLEELKIAAEQVEVSEGTLLSWDELIDKIKEVQGSILTESTTPLTITQTVDQISTRLKSAFGSLQSAYQEIFTRNEETGEKQFASLDEVDITDKFQPILDALQNLDELDGINVDYSSYEDFVSVLSDTSSTAEEVQEQFDRLATDIIYTSDCTNMSAETFNLLAESLSEMGVSNAYEALNSILTLQQALADEGINVQTAMSGEIEKLKDLTFASDETAERLMAYYIQKQLAQNPLGTLDDILQLESLCNALGITGEMLETVTALKLAFEAKESGAHAAGLDESIKAYQEKLAGLVSGYGTFSFDFNAADTKSSSTSGPASSAKAAAETFDWVSQAIEHVEKEIEELDETANSSYSTFSEKNEAFAQEIRKVSEEIDLQQQAYENYMQKADAVGLSDHYRDLAENGASGMEDISDETLKNQISEYQKWYDKAQKTQDKINSLYEKSKDIHVASYENCVQELDTLRDHDSISEREYLDRMNALWETYYADQTEYAAQAKDAKLELLRREKSYLESVADAASNLLNGQAEELRNRQEAEIEVLEAKKRPLEAQLELLEAQEEKEDRILALQKAQYELKRAEHQRDKLTYVDGQMVYRTDEAGIRNAKDAVDDAEYNIVKGNIQDRIDAYDKEIDKVKERYEAEIAGIERLENEWQKALALRENALTAGDFESMFGEGSIEKLLSGDSSMISTWRQAYLEALGGIDFTASGTIGEMTARYAELAGLDLSSITEQTMTVASQFHAIHDAVGRLNASIGSEPATDTPDGTSAKQTQSSEDSLSLSGALQNTYDIASEVLPEEAEMLHTIAEAANTAAAAIHELKTAIASLSALPLSPDSLTISGNAYASGTKRAQKGLAVIGEEKPEMIITNGQKAFLAKQPTLLRMEGGETVYNGEETERMLKARGFQPVTPEKFPLLKSFASYRPSEIRQRFVPQMISPANTAAASAIQNAGRAVNNSFNNGTSFTTGDVHIHCPGITKDEVAKQIGTELTNVFSGMSLNAYQHVNITR